MRQIARSCIDATTSLAEERALVPAAEQVFALRREYFVGNDNRTRHAVFIKEVLLASGCRIGANLATLSRLVGLSSSTASRRYESARRKIHTDAQFDKLVSRTIAAYDSNKCT